MRDKIAYSIGLLGKEVTYSVLNCVIFLYCFQALKLNISFLGVLYLTGAVIGVVVSPLIGMLLDNTNSCYGKYKVWLVSSTFFCLLALGGFYFLPQLGNNAQEHLFFISCIYTLWTLSYCMLDLPGWSILSTFNTNNTTRDVMAQVPNFTFHIGVKIMIFVAIPILYHRQSLIVLTATAYSNLIIACALILGLSQLFMIVIMGHNHKHNSNRQIRPMAPLSTQFTQRHPAFEGANSVTGNATTTVTGEAIADSDATSDNTDTASIANTDNTTENAYTAGTTDIASLATAINEPFSLDNVPQNVLLQQESSQAYQPPQQQQQLQQFSCESAPAAVASRQQNAQPSASHFKFFSGINNFIRRITFTRPQPLLNEAVEIDPVTAAALAKEATFSDPVTTVNTVNTIAPNYQEGEQYYASHHEPHRSTPYYHQAPAARPAVTAATNATLLEASGPRLTAPISTALVSTDHSNHHELLSTTTHRQKTVNNILSLRTNLQVLLQNDQLLVVFLSTVLLYTAYGLIFGGIFACFVVQQVFLSPYIQTILVIGFILHLGAISSFELLAKRFSNPTLFNASLALMLVGFSLILLEQNLPTRFLIPLLSISYFLSSVGVGLNKVVLTSMAIDTVDYGEFKLSVRSDGLIFALRAVAHHASKIVIFFYYSNALLIFFDHKPKAYPPDSLELNLNVNLAVTLVIILLVFAFLIYINLYKLNGAFYRNVLNNLQFLKHNQHWHSHAPTTNRFMLRYALDESTMIIKLKARNINDMVRAMVQKLSDVHAITSEHDYMVDLTKRLRQGDCGIAEGIAMPHAKSSAVRRATVVVATLDTPLDLGALDGRKCDLIFLLASPDDGFTHLNLLGRLSLLLNEPNFADKLRASGSPTELFERLIQCEKHLVH